MAVRFGILGLGRGRKTSEQILAADGAELACVCDLQEDKAQAFASGAGCDWTTDFDSMLARDDIDVIGVFTSSGTHCDFCIQVLKAGKHAVTTKPMDIRVEKCEEAIQVAKDADKILAVDFGNRYSVQNQKLKAGLGKLGNIFLGDVRMKWLREQSYYDGGWPPGWRSRKETEGGSIANQGVHFVDLVYWFLGPVKEISGRSGTLAHEIETEDITIANLTFQSGAWGLIETTTSNYPNLGTTIEISGTNGTLVWSQRGGVEMFRTRDEENVDWESIEIPDAPKDIAEDMVSALTKGTTPVVTGEIGKGSVEIFCGVYESARTGETVVLNQDQ